MTSADRKTLLGVLVFNYDQEQISAKWYSEKKNHFLPSSSCSLRNVQGGEKSSWLSYKILGLDGFVSQRHSCRQRWRQRQEDWSCCFIWVLRKEVELPGRKFTKKAELLNLPKGLAIVLQNALLFQEKQHKTMDDKYWNLLCFFKCKVQKTNLFC